MRHLTLVVLTIFAASCSPSSSKALGPVGLQGRSGTPGTALVDPWPQASHDARRSGSSDAVGPQSGHLRWTRTLQGNVTPGPVIGRGGIIYAATNAGVLHAIDSRSGEDVWTYAGRHAYGSDLSTSPALLPDGTVLWPGPDGLTALTAQGRKLWNLPVKGSLSSPAVDGTRVVVGVSNGDVIGVDVTNGTPLWTAHLKGTSYGSVALAPKDPHRAYQTVDDQLVALDDDKVAWRAGLDEIVEVSPAVAPDGTVVVGGNAPYERAFSPSGKQLWRYDRQAETYSSPVVTEDGIAYFGDHDGVVTGIDVESGGVLARYLGPTKRPKDNRSIGIWTSPVIDAHHDVYWGTRSGHVRGVAPDGRELFDLDVDATADSYPALADGLLVVGLTDGRLLGIAA
jgi:outer membrane protein assembly factor BamB